MSHYKTTLNLPETRFPMRANLAKREPSILQRWYEQDLYGIIRAAKKGKEIFILHDGAPYANGSIHLGHSVNKIHKDIIIKSKGLFGFDAPYVPGWDCHGLPIELQVEKLYGKPDEKISATEFRQKCRAYATEQINKQKQDFIRLGVIGDWIHPYTTMDFKTEANIIRVMGKIISNGHLIKGVKPVHWCTDCRSSLAEAEVEYYEKTSPSIDVAFHAVDATAVALKFGINNFIGSIALVIWTTTPWTLPANRAISLHPNFDYQLLKIDNQYLILVKELVDQVMKRAGITTWSVVGSCQGLNLESLRFQHPFMQFNIPVILGEHISLDTGTGAVHTAGGHGQEDFLISQKYALEISNLVGANGCYLHGTHPLLDGKFVFKANTIIIDLLRDKSALLYETTIVHSYPYCWRHKIPIIFRATPQWFISMDQKGLKRTSLEAIKSVRWIPAWGYTRIKNMLDNRPDWCISRQRTWGVPMVLLVHRKTETLHPRSIELIEVIAKHVERKGIQAWWDLDIADLLGADAVNYHKITDTLDVWFDSGSTHASVVDVRPEFHGHSPDLYLEGVDQHRGWFMSSLIISSAMQCKAPYKEVLTHGFTVDDQGRKMSKSIGNTIQPKEVINKLGSDILRLWVASTNYNGEIAISDEILKRTVDSYRRIRNTARFLLANLNGFNPSTDCVPPEEMVALDRWVVGRTLAAQLDIKKAYANYDSQEVVQRLMQFSSIEMGSFYFEIIKDRQYTTKSNSIARRSCQTALFHIAEALVRWIAPIISFTADEIWGFLPGERVQYVFTEEWYSGLFPLSKEEKINDSCWAELLQIRTEVHKILEQSRINKRLGSPLETTVTLYADQQLAKRLNILKDELHFVLVTSAAHVAPLSDAPIHAQTTKFVKGLKITINMAEGKRCPRCWHYTTDIGSRVEYTDICGRCVLNVAGEGEKRHYA